MTQRKRQTYRQKAEQHAASLAALRSDPSKTAERYDEIIALRMLLIDVVEYVEVDIDDDRMLDPLGTLRFRIEERAKRWGKKGDCV